jgi:Ribbon-helix-helix protein, copG family
MGIKRFIGLRLSPEQIEALEVVKAKTGAPRAEQIRRAIDMWLKAQDVPPLKVTTADARLADRRGMKLDADPLPPRPRRTRRKK